MAESITERVEPSETDKEIYVGLEHLDSDSLKINRYGTPDDVKGTKLRVRPGYIIFGKRRAYQRKVAIADFDGICSAHAMVLRSKDENVIKDFFPFFLQSDIFMERALEISVGSLSPTINWKTLKTQEFSLPPLGEQRRMAEILWALEDALRKKDEFASAARKYKKVLMKHLFTYGPVGQEEIPKLKMKKTEIWMVPEGWEVEEFNKVLKGKVRNGIYKPKMFHGSGTKMINMGELFAFPEIKQSDMERIQLSDKEMDLYLVDEGDLLFARRSIVAAGAGLCSIVADSGEPRTFESSIIRARPNVQLVHSYYLFYYFRSPLGRTSIRRLIRHVAVAGITGSDLIKALIPLPPLAEQQKIADILSKLDRNIEGFERHRKRLQNLKKRLLNDLLSGEMRLRGAEDGRSG